MNIQIQTINLEMTDALRNFVHSKFSNTTRIISDSSVLCTVDLERTTNHHKQGEVYKVFVRIRTPKDLFQIENTGEDLYATIDLAKDDIERLIVNNSKKKRSLFRRAAARFKKMMRRQP